MLFLDKFLSCFNNKKQLINTPCEKLPAPYINSLPEEIIDLLWFADGPLKNYTSAQHQSVIFISSAEEPSLIHQNDVIGQLKYPAPPIGYYPSYQNLSPDARRCYLEWLKNVDNDIDIGYVFIFYYGLERCIFLSKNDRFLQAFKMILRLRKHHFNKSFQAYSYDALIGACIVNNRMDLLIELFDQGHNLSPLTLACMAKLNIGLSPDDILSLATSVGFTNKRYINKESALFNRTLSSLLLKKFGGAFYPLSEENLSKNNLSAQILSANYSLEFRTLSVPDILKSGNLQKNLYDILYETHQEVKLILKEQRQTNKT